MNLILLVIMWKTIYDFTNAIREIQLNSWGAGIFATICLESSVLSYWLTSSFVFLPVIIFYLSIIKHLRYLNVDQLKHKYHYTRDKSTFQHMTVQQAQDIQRNLAEHDFPFLFEFGWIVEFFKTATVPDLSKVLIKSGQFTSKDPMIAHARQQDTVCLMTAIMAQPLRTEFSALAIARINEHHNKYGPYINSDTVLFLSWMWLNGPIQWINIAGWRKLEPFEEHAMFILWRELSVLLGCKWVPSTYEDFEFFSNNYAQMKQEPDPDNFLYSNSIMDDILFEIPVLLKPLGRKLVIALLDQEVRHCNLYDDEFSPCLRSILFQLLKAFGWFQRNCCLPRRRPRVLSPASYNANGLVNFPEYTYPATPFYVVQTFWNQWGLHALFNRLRGLPIPGPKYYSQGVSWESMGAKEKDEKKQEAAEKRVRDQANEIKGQDHWGFRPYINFPMQPIVTTRKRVHDQGYGSATHAYDKLY